MSEGLRTTTCPYCGNKLPLLSRTNYNGLCYFKNTMARRAFCSKECFDKYMEQFVVEIYNGLKIYCVEFDGEKRYMPYWECGYYFTGIEDCKMIMDLKFGAAW